MVLWSIDKIIWTVCLEFHYNFEAIDPESAQQVEELSQCIFTAFQTTPVANQGDFLL